MKVQFRNRSSEAKARMLARLLNAIEQKRRAVGWSQADLNCLDVFGCQLRYLYRNELLRLFKDLCELRKFVLWRERRAA